MMKVMLSHVQLVGYLQLLLHSVLWVLKLCWCKGSNVWNVDKKPVEGYYIQRNHIWLTKSLGIDGG